MSTFNDDVLSLATKFFTGDTSLFDKESENFKNLFLAMASDNNSSSLRESVTLHYLKFDQFQQKHGADGKDPVTGKLKEVKPRYVSAGNKFSGALGSFNDITMDLIDKKLDLDVICSLFVGNRLVFIFEFPLTEIEDKLRLRVTNAKLGKRVVGDFSHTDVDIEKITVQYVDFDLIEKTDCIVKPLLLKLKYKMGLIDASKLPKQTKLNKKSK